MLSSRLVNQSVVNPFILGLHLPSLQLPTFALFAQSAQKFGEWASYESCYLWWTYLASILFFSAQNTKRSRGDDKSRISFSLFNFYKIFSLARSWTDSSQSIFLAPCPFQTYSEARTNFPDERLTLHSPLEPSSSSCFTAHHSFLIILSPPPFLSLMYFHFVSSPENISQDIICQDGFGLWNKVFQCPTTFPRGWQEFLSSKKVYFSLIC